MPRATRHVLVLFLLHSAVFCGLSGCNLVPAALEPAAVKYYNYMQGLSPKTKYSSFTSPAYRKAMPKESIAKLDEVMSRSRKKNERATPVTADKLRVASESSYGLTAAGTDASFASQALGETRWVKDGGKWYLHLGTDAEISAYGAFPSHLALPRIERGAGQGGPEAPQ